MGNIYTVANNPEGLFILSPIAKDNIYIFQSEYINRFYLFNKTHVLLSFLTSLIFLICFLKVTIFLAVSF